MIDLGVVLSLFAAVFKAGKSISTKFSTLETGEYTTSWTYRTISMILFGLVLVFVTGGYTLPQNITFWGLAVLNASILSTTTLLITKAFKVSDISVISPLMAVFPVLVTIPAWVVLNETPTVLAGLGILFVFLGTYLLQIESYTDSYLLPFKRLRTDKGAQYIGIMLLLASVTPTIDKLGLSYAKPIQWVFTTHLGMSLILGTILIYSSDNPTTEIPSNWKPLLLIGVFNAILWGTQIYAYDITQVAYVQAIKRGSIFISILAGYILFEEKNIKNRFVGGGVIFLGILCIIFGA